MSYEPLTDEQVNAIENGMRGGRIIPAWKLAGAVHSLITTVRALRCEIAELREKEKQRVQAEVRHRQMHHEMCMDYERSCD